MMFLNMMFVYIRFIRKKHR